MPEIGWLKTGLPFRINDRRSKPLDSPGADGHYRLGIELVMARSNHWGMRFPARPAAPRRSAPDLPSCGMCKAKIVGPGTWRIVQTIKVGQNLLRRASSSFAFAGRAAHRSARSQRGVKCRLPVGVQRRIHGRAACTFEKTLCQIRGLFRSGLQGGVTCSG